MLNTERNKKEYGGYLPLELNPGEEYFARYEDHLLRYNTVKAALHKVINELNCKKIYIPYYYCPSTTEAIQKENIEVCFYHIDENLMPADVPDEEGSIILVVDYFGVCGKKVKEFAKCFRNSEIVFDFAHDFFEKPVIDDHRHNIYSAKKFFGVPDGSYLISLAFEKDTDSFSYANNYSGYLIKSYEEGTNSAYQMKRSADDYLATNYCTMSALSVGLLQNVNYNEVMKKRQRNYNAMLNAFKDINELTLSDSHTAYQFPLLIREKGQIIKQQLINSRIYVPTLWSGEILKINGNDFELNMMNDCVFLPIDQRYDDVDVGFLVSKTLEFV